MKRIIVCFILFVCSFLFTGCKTKPIYYFGSYSKTLYAFEKNQNDEALLNHKQELERVISESEAKKLSVPPGIYAELGYINLKANSLKEAIRLFQTESQLYPESKHLMERLIQSAKAKESSSSNVPDLSAVQGTGSN